MKYYLIFALLFFARPALAGDSLHVRLKRNVVFFEMLGPGGSFSLNYERILSRTERERNRKTIFTYRTGIGSTFNISHRQTLLHFVNILWRRNRGNFIETGLGTSVGRRLESEESLPYRESYQFYATVSPQIGLRGYKGNTVGRILFTPICWESSSGFVFKPWLAVSVGKQF